MPTRAVAERRDDADRVDPCLVDPAADGRTVVVDSRLVQVRGVKVDAAHRVQADLAAVVRQLVEPPQQEGHGDALAELEDEVPEVEGARDADQPVQPALGESPRPFARPRG